MVKSNIDRRVQRMIEENWEDHAEYCSSNKGYRRDFIQDMDKLFATIEMHTTHTVLLAVQVHLEEHIRDNEVQLQTETDQEEIEFLKEDNRGCQLFVDELDGTREVVKEIALRGVTEVDSEAAVGV